MKYLRLFLRSFTGGFRSQIPFFATIGMCAFFAAAWMAMAGAFAKAHISDSWAVFLVFLPSFYAFYVWGQKVVEFVQRKLGRMGEPGSREQYLSDQRTLLDAALRDEMTAHAGTRIRAELVQSTLVSVAADRNGLYGLLSEISGGNALHEYPELRERVQDALADTERRISVDHKDIT